MRLRLIIFVAVALASHASACMWDYDTLRDEQRGLPGVFEIITGRYERRSTFFYSDRITKMRALLATEPNNQPAIDNLAVALFRTGQTQEAIDTLLDKEKRFPNQYTTASNLATFYMLSGNPAAAVPLLEKALQINPNAHFGREKYQLKLAKFLVAASQQKEYPTQDFLGNQPFYTLKDGKVFRDNGEISADPHFTLQNWRSPAKLDASQSAALDGILGMIRFGTDQSADLFYALGNLLVQKGDRNLAVRAYARAVALKHPLAKEIETLQQQAGAPISPAPPTVELMQAERAAGEAWAQSYMSFTDELIRSNQDPELEANFTPFYLRSGPQNPPLGLDVHDWAHYRGTDSIPAAIFLFVLIGLGAQLVIRRFRRRKSGPAKVI